MNATPLTLASGRSWAPRRDVRAEEARSAAASAACVACELVDERASTRLRDRLAADLGEAERLVAVAEAAGVGEAVLAQCRRHLESARPHLATARALPRPDAYATREDVAAWLEAEGPSDRDGLTWGGQIGRLAAAWSARLGRVVWSDEPNLQLDGPETEGPELGIRHELRDARRSVERDEARRAKAASEPPLWTDAPWVEADGTRCDGVHPDRPAWEVRWVGDEGTPRCERCRTLHGGGGVGGEAGATWWASAHGRGIVEIRQPDGSIFWTGSASRVSEEIRSGAETAPHTSVLDGLTGTRGGH